MKVASSLIQERDFLLKSMDDLEAEWAAGDMDRSDYEELKADYTVRAAAVLRQIKEKGTAAQPSSPAVPPGSKTWLWMLGLAAFTLLAGLLMARTVGERGVNDQITGSVEETPREQVLRCQQMGQNPELLLESLQCFDDVLVEDPQNVEALTYRGWYVFLASRQAEDAGAAEQSGELLVSSARFLDRAVDVDPTFADARAFRAIVAERLGQPEAACLELKELAGLNPPQMISGLTAPLSERLGC